MRAKLDAEKDLADLNRALAYARRQLTSELGLGGLLSDLTEEQREAVKKAIDLLRDVEPECAMIRLYQWRHPEQFREASDDRS